MWHHFEIKPFFSQLVSVDEIEMNIWLKVFFLLFHWLRENDYFLLIINWLELIKNNFLVIREH